MLVVRSIFVLDFYPRPPRGGRLDFYYPVFANLGISIHALREEGDMVQYRFRP